MLVRGGTWCRCLVMLGGGDAGRLGGRSGVLCGCWCEGRWDSTGQLWIREVSTGWVHKWGLGALVCFGVKSVPDSSIHGLFEGGQPGVFQVGHSGVKAGNSVSNSCNLGGDSGHLG